MLRSSAEIPCAVRAAAAAGFAVDLGGGFCAAGRGFRGQLALAVVDFLVDVV